MFFAPALLWIGATLLLVRLRGRAARLVARGPPAAARRRRCGFLLASAGRRGAAINRGLVVVGLLLAFGVNLGIFSATYDQQARVDAQLTLGADVVVTAPPGVTATARPRQRRSHACPASPAPPRVDHSYAYVGPDLQDTFGIDPAHAHARRRRCATPTSSAAAPRRCSTGCGTTRTGSSSRRRRSPTTRSTRATCCRLRVLDHATGRFRVVPFHVVGIVQEFPSAPKDSFMVANLALPASA